jgi:hypothetical protein
MPEHRPDCGCTSCASTRQRQVREAGQARAAAELKELQAREELERLREKNPRYAGSPDYDPRVVRALIHGASDGELNAIRQQVRAEYDQARGERQVQQAARPLWDDQVQLTTGVNRLGERISVVVLRGEREPAQPVPTARLARHPDGSASVEQRGVAYENAGGAIGASFGTGGKPAQRSVVNESVPPLGSEAAEDQMARRDALLSALEAGRDG